MLTSLIPGSLFYTPGLNRKSTPTPPTVTPDELDKLYGRQELDGNPWPYESPVHSIYDVKNTSTKMIILNNKYGKDRTRLRGYYTGPSIRKSERHVDPGRHSRVSSPRNSSHHERCLYSGTPYFEPTIKPHIEWTNQTERPSNSLSEESGTGDQKVDSPRRLDLARSAVNPKRHLHCQVPSATICYTDSVGDQSPRPGSRISRASIPPKRYFKEYTDLTIGEKLYLWSIEKIYNIENLKRLKQEQYQKLLELEAKKGQTVSWKEYDKYMRYIQSASSRHYGTKSPSIFRARSAHSYRSESGRQSPSKNRDDNETMSRPRTTSSRTRRSKKVEPLSGDKKQNQEKDEKSDESQIESVTTSKSDETTDKTAPKTDDEKAVKKASKRPTSKTSQSQDQRPKSSKSSKSISPYATPSPYASRSSSAKSYWSSRPSSHKSNKSKTGSTKSSDKEINKEDNSKENEFLHHKEGVDRPKSRLGHPAAGDKGSHYLSDMKTYSYSSDDSDSEDFSPKKTTENTVHNHDSDTSSIKSTDEDYQSQQNVRVHRVPSGTQIVDQDQEESVEPFLNDKSEDKTLDTDRELKENSFDLGRVVIENGDGHMENDHTEEGRSDKNVERGIVLEKNINSDDEDLDRRPNTELDKIEY